MFIFVSFHRAREGGHNSSAEHRQRQRELQVRITRVNNIVACIYLDRLLARLFYFVLFHFVLNYLSYADSR